MPRPSVRNVKPTEPAGSGRDEERDEVGEEGEGKKEMEEGEREDREKEEEGRRNE